VRRLSFHDLHLSEPLLKAVHDAGYSEPTAIQAAAIPPVLMGKDLIGVAQTGTGKTASFVLPMIDILAEGRARARMPRSLILEPTRELAAQVAENFEKYGKYHKLSMALLIGGVAFGDQDKALEKGVDVLIATPGRLLDQHGRGKILLSGVGVLVIDEADRMLDMGFIPDVERICALLKPERQTLLFSATMPGPVKALADRFMTSPKLVEVARPATTNADIEQRLIAVPPASHEKRAVLRSLLADPAVQTAIIFCNRKTTVRDLAQSLKRHGLSAGQIHGDMDQSDRIRELDRFKAGDITILVASDVAARGLDIKGVSHVFNFDVPWHPDDYVHRIGRTGRAGASGISITLATPEDAEAIGAIEKLTGQKIPRIGAPPKAEAEPEARAVRPSRPPRDDRAPRSQDRPQRAEERAPADARAPRPERAPRDRRPPRAPDYRRDEDGPSGPGFGDAGAPAFLSVSARR
jgi:superfamily II DNA/RNA helicase